MNKTVKNISLCISILSILFLAASCGKNDDHSKKTTSKHAAEPTDLTGSWVEKGKKGSDSFQAAYIKDNVIEIYWITDMGEFHSLYWSGTYDAPKERTDDYTWESVNDKIKTDNAVLASSEDTKTFSYHYEVISYEVTYLGETRIVRLVRADRDYSSLEVTGSFSGEAIDGQEVVLTKSGYVFDTDKEAIYKKVYYAVEIHNPNPEYAVEYPTIDIAVKNTEGKVLATNKQSLKIIAAGDTVKFGDSIAFEGEDAASVEIKVSNGSDSYMHSESSGAVKQSELVISGTSENKAEFSTKYAGMVENTSDKDLSSVCVDIIFKNGDDIIGGKTNVIGNLPKGTSKPFEISVFPDDMYDSYEITAIQW